MGVNRVMLLGNLGADPELRYTPQQNAVCSLRIATGERRKNAAGEWVDHTEWHSVVVWGKTAENCANFLSKGRQVFIEGRLQTRKWQDQDGKDRYKTEIIASTVEFVGGKGDGMSVEKSSAPRKQSSGFQEVSASDLPPSETVSFADDDIPF